MATRAALGLAAILWMAGTLAAVADTLSGRVVRVVDGDTIVLLVSSADGEKRQEKTRLSGVDAPESNQPWGQKAKQALSGYVFGHDVTVEWSKRDRYGRIVGKVLDGERDVNLALVRDGMAWWFRKYAGEQPPVDRQIYEATETAARQRKIGLWADPKPIPPSEWRKGTPGTSPAPGQGSSGAAGCPCVAGGEPCTGTNGGQYCLSADGKKHYSHPPRPAP
jgi:endonuclease YncB( thermonuclease family)